MFNEQSKQEYFQALIEKNKAYEGVFYVGVKTTGIFCRPTCPARKPKYEHCEFFKTAKDALISSYRPCLRCQPLSYPGTVSMLVATLVEAVEKKPEKRWKDKDFQSLSVDASTARRQFKKRFGMTFVEYARARRMGMAYKQIREGSRVIDAQLDLGYESSSGFRDAFSKIMGGPPADLQKQCHILKATWIDTPLGPMIAAGSDDALYCLEFADRRGLEREIERLRNRTKSAIVPGESPLLQKIQEELHLYFLGKLKKFTTPLQFIGSPFQEKAWEALMKIPYGETRSYLEQAQFVGNAKAYRAVANANGANQISIIIPCHRIINNNGELGGYGGGLPRKKWLIEHEKKNR